MTVLRQGRCIGWKALLRKNIEETSHQILIEVTVEGERERKREREIDIYR